MSEMSETSKMSEMSETVGKRVVQLLAQELDCTVVDIGNNTKLVDDLGADSLDMVQIALTLEEEFDIDVPDQLLSKNVKVIDLVEYVNEVTAR